MKQPRQLIRMALWALITSFLVFSPAFGAHDGDKIDRVLQHTLEDMGHSVTLNHSGEPGDEFFTIAAYDPHVTGLQLQATGYASQKVKKALKQVGELFTKGAEAQYGSLAPDTTSTLTIDGIKVKRVDRGAKDYKSVTVNTSMPKMTNLYVDVNPLLTIAVTVQGDRDPVPYMKALIQNLKKAGMMGPVEEGVAFTILVRKDGWLPLDRLVATGSMSPSSITVTGTVVDPDGNPVSGANLHVPSLDITDESDINGKFRLYAPTEGKEPFSLDLTLHLKQPTSGATVSIVGPANPVLPVPGTPKLNLRAADKDGKPLAKAEVELKWTVPRFVKTPLTTAMLDDNGMLQIPMDIRKPVGLSGLTVDESSLNVKLEATVKPRDGGSHGSATFTAPLNLALITGRTVGPDMKPREEKEAPWAVLGDYRDQCLDSWKDDTGEFRLLVQPLHPLKLSPFKGWALRWSDRNRIAMNCLIKPAPTPGKVVDVGLVDVLTVDEHVKRLTDVLKEFCAAMPLTPVEQSDAQSAIKRLVFQANSTEAEPKYRDNFTNNSGVISIPGKAAYYWGTNLMENNDPAYQIIPHELGHFMHHHIIEKYAFRHVFYNKLSTGEHKTWTVPPGSGYKAPYLSFSENTADFFALLFRKFWQDRHPEIKESPYFKLPGYLHEFETDDKAMAVVGAGTPGYKVEGVQTRFLTAFYGNGVNTRPAVVYNDYLNTMLLYVDRKTGWAGTLVNRPARTMYQWVQTKKRVPSGIGTSDVTALANRYRMIPGASPEPTATPQFRTRDARMKIDGKTEDFRSFPVVPVPMGKVVEITGGTVSIDVSGPTTTRTLTIRAPARIKLISRTRVEVQKGLIGADFPVDIVTPGGTVKPTGTVVQVKVDDTGTATIDTLDGTVEIRSADGTTTTLKVGESVQLAADGVLSAVSECNPQALLANLLPDVELPPIPEPKAGFDLSLSLDKVRERTRSMPWWALVAAVLVAFILIGTLLWFMRRFLTALIAGPVLAIGLVAIAHAVLTNGLSEQMSFTEMLFSPYTAWLSAGEWVPAAAWLVAGLAGGMIVGGAFRGLLVGVLLPVMPWLLLVHPVSINDMTAGHVLEPLLNAVRAAAGDLALVWTAAILGAFVGGLVLPRSKRRRQPTVQQQGLRREMKRRNDPDPGPGYDDFDDDDGDDGDD